MFNRRLLRIKVMQALYAFHQSNNNNIEKAEKELLFQLDRVYDLYLYLLLLLVEFAEFESTHTESLKDLYKSRVNKEEAFLMKNKLILQLTLNKDLLSKVKSRKISWQKDHEMVRKLFLELKKEKKYKVYCKIENKSYKDDQEIVLFIFKNYIAESNFLEHYLEEQNIYWADDQELVNNVIIKTLKSFKEDTPTDFPLSPIFKDDVEDKDFIVQLLRKTIINDSEYEKEIADHAKNWEVDRIALIDIILMKMAICEVLNFSSIPIKVSINEYIDISKTYSSPKSKIFINGIIDKLVVKFKQEGIVKKLGRGLIES